MSEPTAIEQLQLELINRARLDPQGEFDLLIADATSQTGVSDSITNALRYFGVDLDVFASQLAGLEAVAPLAWNASLAQAAETHSELMILNDVQSHQVAGEASLLTRTRAAGYDNLSYVAENVYAYGRDPDHIHGGFYIDWGNTATGIQEPAGHRNTILNSALQEVGLAVLREDLSTTAIGPYVVTQNFGARSDYAAQLLGVVYDDLDANRFYGLGEGLGGVTVTAVSVSGASFVTTSWDSGGYQMELAPGSYTVTYSGGGLGLPVTETVVMGSENLKRDALARTVETITGTAGNDVLQGSRAADIILGGDGDDLLNGLGDDDSLSGGAGADTLTGGAGADTLTGGAGFDLADYGREQSGTRGIVARLAAGEVTDSYGTQDRLAGIEAVTGTARADVIDASGLITAVALSGAGGDDTLTGGAGDDTLSGGAGTDTLVLALASGSVVARDVGGVVTLSSAQGEDLVTGIELFAFTDTTLTLAALLAASPGPDPEPEPDPEPASAAESGQRLTGTAGSDTLTGGVGPDTLSGGDGGDLLQGGAGDDGLQGQGGNDTLLGGGGADNLAGSDGDDLIDGGDGDDLIGGGPGNDVIDGGAGNDFMGGGRDDDTLSGGDGNDTVNGGPGNDSLSGGSGDDVIGASFGDDTVSGGAGRDNIGGGTGSDLLQGGDDDDRIGGGEGNDTLSGGGGNDFLAGGGRDDVVSGGAGADTINGGAGDDTLSGGAGADLFVFNTLTRGESDLILDFETGLDRIRLGGVAGTGAQGRFDALEIRAGLPDGGAGVTLTYGGHEIGLADLVPGDLGPGDFIFF
ncbi:CAP domain-containing protein [Puniceibacterium confluentis]|uniref:CAP domain-containing protein n=1 Tax=Puniceibacterium confluentis TaxID=1958944 RepID=UPI0011B6CE91|nr:CAP domain-containing protein [Puniceibacterium confluentis]